jgi:tRNA(fMet)-specific endonuclease VapC
MTYLVDSDWVAEYLKGRATAVNLLDSLFEEDLAISIITFGEIYEGIYYGTDPQRNELVFRSFLRGLRVLGITRTIARRFALIRGKLRAEGRIIPQPDILIAATALQYDLTLLTRNLRDFERIPDLKLHRPR